MKREVSWKKLVMSGYPYIVLIIVIVCFGILTHGMMFSARNLQLIADQSFELILGCLGALFLFAQGEIDFTMGATIAVSAILSAYVSQTSVLLAFVVAVLVGLAVGVFNGVIYAKFGIGVFFLTFCASNVIAGFLGPLSKHSTVMAPFGIIKLDNFALKMVVLIVCLILFYLMYEKTRLGKVSKALGVNPTAVEHSGIRMKFYKFMPFLFTGLICGLIAFFNLCKTGGAASSTGQLFHFDVLVALSLGGAAMGGPRVRFRCAIVGALIITMLTSGMNLAGVPVEVQSLSKGILFLLVIVATKKLGDLATE